MATPKSRSANDELHRGADDGSLQMVGKDWSYNHPDLILPDPARPCDPGCDEHDH
jgi:hypothetical protein